MSEQFDPSPRESKRRRTSTYSANRRHVSSASKTAQPVADASPVTRAATRLSSRVKAPAESRDEVDSAYGSKEDSLVEDELQAGDAVPLQVPPSSRAATLQSAESLEIPETPENAAAAATGTSRRKAKTPRSSEAGVGLAGRTDVTGSTGRSKRKTPASGSVASKRKAETAQPRRSGQRDASRGMADTVGPEIAESEDELQVEAGTTPVREGSIRARRRPRRYSIDSQSTREPSLAGDKSRPATESAAASPQPKGILTPSKGRRLGQRKSVLFDPQDKQIEEQLGFKDIDQSVKKGRRSARATKTTTNFAEDNDTDAAEEEPTTPAPANDDPLLDFDNPTDILASLEPINEVPTSDTLDDSPALTSIKAKVLARLTSAKPSAPAPHLASQESTLTNLLTSTVVSGESNSLLLLGPRGAGKTLLLEHVLSQLTAQYSALFHVVRLNGFFQTDDRLALREIWRQLGRETQDGEGDENTAAPISYADTLASLLSLLSHPDEMDVDADEAEGPDAIDLDAPTRAAKSVVLVLDEFDLFTLHPRQTLLYNLFDIAQSRKAPIAVVGCSTRMDVVESLEKRVKSRFSHRWLHVPPVRTLDEMRDVVERALLVGQQTEGDDDDVLMEGQEDEYIAEATRWDDHIKKTFLPSEAVSHLISQTFYSTKSIPTVFSALHASIATLTLNNPSPTPPVVHHNTTTHLTLTPHLPALHLTLLAALASPSNPAPLPTLSTTYAHYVHLLARTRLAHASARGARTTGAAASLRAWSRALCARAWEELVRWGVLVPQGGGGGGGGGETGGDGDEWVGVRMQLEPEEVLWALRMRGGGAGGEGAGGGAGGGEAGVLASWVRGEIV